MSRLPIRYALLLALEPRGTPKTVAYLVRELGPQFDLRPRPSKLLSDLLRVEIRRGRVYRTGWGRYQLEKFPRTTRRRAVASQRAISRSSCNASCQETPRHTDKDKDKDKDKDNNATTHLSSPNEPPSAPPT